MSSSIWRHLLLLAMLYTVAWGGGLLNASAIYWDGWVLQDDTTGAIFGNIGNPVAGAVFSLMSGVGNGIAVHRIAVFTAFLLVGLLSYLLLRRLPQFSRSESLAIAALVMVFPVNYARISLAVAWYGYSLFLFFAGFYLWVLYHERHNLLARLVALALFFLSFFTNSLLVFFILPYLYVFYLYYLREGMVLNKGGVMSGGLSFALRNADFTLLPILFFILKGIYFVPIGLYAGSYNQISLAGLVAAMPLSLASLYSSFLEPITLSLSALGAMAFAMAFATVILLIRYASRAVEELDEVGNSNSAVWPMIALGLLLFLLAVFPYNAVGKLPLLQDWNSRNQLLVPFGGAMLLFYLLRLMKQFFALGTRGYLFSLVLPILLFALHDMRVMNDYAIDWLKQSAVIARLKEAPQLHDSRGATLLFVDHAYELNAMQRHYRFYELSGMTKAALGDESRLSVAYEGYQGEAFYQQFREHHYNIDNHPPASDFYLIELNALQEPSLKLRLRALGCALQDNCGANKPLLGSLLFMSVRHIGAQLVTKREGDS